MVQKNKERVTKTRKNNFFLSNPLRIGLFVVLVIAFVFIGSYSSLKYFSKDNGDRRLKGELATFTGNEETGGGFVECTSHEDCGAQPLGLNELDPNDWIYIN